MDPKQYLIEWVENFAKNKDVFLKSIISTYRDQDNCDLIINHKHKNHLFFVEPFIKDVTPILNKLSKIKEDRWSSLVTANNKDNLDLIIKNWKDFVKLGSKFSIYFVNPFSELDKKWIIFPSTHHSIADKESLEKGLKSMFEMVDNIEEKEFLDKTQ